MENELKKQIVVGTIVLIGIFIIVIGIVNGIDFAATYFGSQRAEESAASDQAGGAEATPAGKEVPAQEYFDLPTTAENILIFPLAIATDATDTTFILENNNDKPAQISLTLINPAGGWHTYNPWEVNTEQYQLELGNLANKPDSFNPGVAVITADQPIAAIAKITNQNGLTNRPLRPYLEPARDIIFDLSPAAGSNIPQNTLILTNYSNSIAEAKLSFTGEDSNAETKPSPPIEIKPHETKTIDLIEIVGSRVQLGTYESLLVSGTSAVFSGAIATLDNTQNMWINISGGEAR